MYDSDDEEDERNEFELGDITDLEQARKLFDETHKFDQAYERYCERKEQDAFDEYKDSYGSSDNQAEDTVNYVAEQMQDHFGTLRGKISIGKTDHKRWSVVEDSSVQDVKSGDENASGPPTGAEIVSPTFTDVKTCLDWLFQIFDFIDNENFYTNKTTGLHISIGTFNKGVAANGKPLDLLKLFLFLGDTYVLEQFKRTGNIYAKPVVPDLLEYLNANDDITGPDTNYKLLISRLNHEIVKHADKYRTCNVSKLSDGSELSDKGYLEFRGMGGRDYHSRKDEVRITILRYVKAIQLACDPNAARQEYMKKLGTLLNKDAPVVNDIQKLLARAWLITQGIITSKEFLALISLLIKTCSSNYIRHKYNDSPKLEWAISFFTFKEAYNARYVVADVLIDLGSQHNKIKDMATIKLLVKVRKAFNITKQELKHSYDARMGERDLFNYNLNYLTFVKSLPSNLQILFR